MKTFQPFVLVTTNIACCDENGKIEEIQNNKEVVPVQYEKWNLDNLPYDVVLKEVKKICPSFEENGFGYKITNISAKCSEYYIKHPFRGTVEFTIYNLLQTCRRLDGYLNEECYVRTKEIYDNN